MIVFLHILSGLPVNQDMEKNNTKQLSFSFEKETKIDTNLRKFKVGSYVSWVGNNGLKEYGHITNIWWEKENYHFAKVYNMQGGTDIRMLSHFKLEETFSDE